MMYRYVLTFLSFFVLQAHLHASEIKESDMSIYDIDVTRINGEEISMSHYRGKVLLIVNVASKCGFTGQYDGLEKLYQRYKDNGLMVLGFPCNQFGAQEPGSHEEIASFCRINYGVSFDMFEKIDVNGNKAHPLYQYLKSAATGFLGSEGIKWNFTKFLVDREGNVVKRYGSTTKPAAIAEEIEKLLNN